jgi:protein arginine N-methyltransferase 1
MRMDQRLLLMHQAMLGDRPRLRAYDDALRAAVGEGDVVVDVGAGTLALTLLALRHGARHVYAVEADPEMVAIAERIVEDNALKDRVTVVCADARTVRLAEPADVVVAELLGNLGPEEAMAETVAAVVRRNLRTGGRVVPQRLRTWLAPIAFDNEGWGLWRDDFHGFRLDVVAEAADPRAHLHFFQRPPRLLAEPVAVLDADLVRGARTGPPRPARMTITEPSRLDAVVGYFTADFAAGTDGSVLSNFPPYPGCNWAAWIWPLRHREVAAGEEMAVTVRRPAAGRARLAGEWALDCRIVRRGGG